LVNNRNLNNYIENIKDEYIDFYEYDVIVLNNKWFCSKRRIKDIAKLETNKWLSLRRFNGNIALMLVDSIFSLRTNYEDMVKRILIPFYQKFINFKINDFKNLGINDLLKINHNHINYQNTSHPFSYINRWKLFKTFVTFFMREFEGKFDKIHNWAKTLNIKDFLKSKSNYYDFKGFGISGIQYLRMQFGVNTIKPESRIKNTLKSLNINFKSDYKLINELENYAELMNMRFMELGFMLWYAFPLLKSKSIDFNFQKSFNP